MSKVKQKTSQRLDRKKKAIVQPARASNQSEVVDRFAMPRLFHGGGSIDSQVAMLKGMNRAQRHGMLTHMSTLHGNRHVMRVVARLRQNNSDSSQATTSQSSEHAAPTTSRRNGQPITSSPSPSPAQTPLRPDSLPLLQAKLTVNEADDQYEQEADQVANAVMRMSAPSPSSDEEDDSPPIQRLAISSIQARADGSGEVSSDVESRIQGLQGGGQPLPESERHFFESRMGADFSGVRIHSDTNAAQTSHDIQARAFTVGNDIAFNSGEYQPKSSAGRHLLAHELTHTIQQGAAGPLQAAVQAPSGTDTQSDQLNQSIQAKAFTTGQDVAVRQGEYNPGSRGGQELIAHELGHVVQQNGGAVQRSRFLERVEVVQEKENNKIIQRGAMLSKGTQPTVLLKLEGPKHEKGNSFALVEAEGKLTDPSQRVHYDIKWDANVVPGGNHLGQQEGVASDWTEDKSPNGASVGDRNSPEAKYFDDKGNVDKNGLTFSFNDGIEQKELNGGSWWFRLKVVGADGKELASTTVKVDWTH